MKELDLTSLVAKAIESNWPTFAAEHPRLAAAIDQSLLIEQAADLLEDEPAYRAAMQKAELVGAIGDTVESFISQWIVRWLRTLA
ncbi:MAG TPA: hypothetical protein VL282_15755 [Tepidisphaeraceae bacterium]|jgi:hypothetical protein|nr:hypothetical protein [Tepidisphaeraceae bacterium]